MQAIGPGRVPPRVRSVVGGCVFALAAALAAAEPAREIGLPAVFGDHMVLQREVELPVWGTARPGGEVVVEIAGQSRSAVVGQDGSWRVTLEPLPAGGPHELVVRGEETVILRDVLVGEVWLASGQSNMEMPLAAWGRVLDHEVEIARADYPQVRLFQVERDTAVRPRSDVRGEGWRPCAPETVAGFSSTAYFFGRRLHRELGVPVGLIHTSWGGTAAEAWTSAGTLETMDDFQEAARAVRATTDAELVEMAKAWAEATVTRQRALVERDAGLSGSTPLWAAPDLDDSAWQTMELPTTWEQAGHEELDGVVWFRRAVELPEGWAGAELELGLGPIDDADDTFFNGVRVGGESTWSTPRRYAVPAAVTRPGHNVIAVRVVDTLFSGGLWGKAEDFRLRGPAGPPLELAGDWRYRIGLDLDEVAPLPPSPHSPHRPSVLYNAMLRPLAPYAVRGVIWYQGESNVERAHQYRRLFPALIRDWRATWGRDDLPFYFVQLANYLPAQPDPGESAWAELREAQLETLSLPATGMAVSIDIGDADDIHPKNKQEVGNRLARLALRRLYGRAVPDSGPLYREMRVESDRIRLFFDHAYGGLEARNGALRGFAVAGEDRRFRWADAAIDGDTVVVWSPEIEDPVAARYGWADNPACNLYNAAGLPASPFRTDRWPGVTEFGTTSE